MDSILFLISVLPSFHLSWRHNVIVDFFRDATEPFIKWLVATSLLSRVVFPSHLSEAPNFEPLPNHSPISSLPSFPSSSSSSPPPVVSIELLCLSDQLSRKIVHILLKKPSSMAPIAHLSNGYRS